MVESGLLTIPARRGLAIRVRSGRTLQVINTHGHQVVDTCLVANRRRPIITLVEDSSPGVHDTLIAACDRYRYEQLGCTTYHENCSDNLAAALAEIGLAALVTPSPRNLFMNISVIDGRRLEFRPPVLLPVNAGDPVEAHVRLLG
jgi:hypothetical protein